MQIKSWKHLSKANSAQVCNDMILTRRGLLDIMWRGINMHLLTHNHPFPLEMPCHRFKFLVYELLLPALKFYLLFPNQRTKEPKKNQPKNQPPFSAGNAPVIAPSLLLSSTCPLLMLLMRPRCTFQNLSKQSRQAGSWRVQVWWKKPSIFDLRQLPRIQAPVTWPTAPVSRHATLQPSQGGVVRCWG